MKDSLSRIMICIAALDLSDAELKKAIREFRELSQEDIQTWIGALRHLLGSRWSRSRAIDVVSEREVNVGRDLSVGTRVERLLKGDAGLSTSEAVHMLSTIIVEGGLLKKWEIPPLSRKSLQEWVLRLGKLIPEKEILRLATLLRNQLVHVHEMDWSLRKPGEK